MEAIMKCRTCGYKWRKQSIEKNPSVTCPSCGSSEIGQSAISMSGIRATSFDLSVAGKKGQCGNKYAVPRG